MIFRSFLPKVTKKHVEKRILETHPIHLFRIIQDVDSYSQFLPLCSYSRVLRRSPDAREFDATLTVGLPPLFEETYTSRVDVKPESLIVSTRSIESKLFDSLQSKWKLRKVQGDITAVACHVDFEVEMTVSDPLIVSVLDKVLQEVAGRQVTAFEQRCRQIPMPAELNDYTKQQE